MNVNNFLIEVEYLKQTHSLVVLLLILFKQSISFYYIYNNLCLSGVMKTLRPDNYTCFDFLEFKTT
jgi:hypothetical protein